MFADDMARTRLDAMAGLILGSILINTLPVWLEELANRYALSPDHAGVLATLVLLGSGAACWARSVLRHWAIDLASAVLAVVLPVLALHASQLALGSVLAAGLVFGAALGVVLGRSFSAAFAGPDALKTISISLTVALLVSLVIVLVSAGLRLAAIGQIALCAAGYCGVLLLLVWRPPSGGQAGMDYNWMPDWRTLLYLPFFIAMGGFWAFVEIYGNAHAIAHIKEVLAASYVVSALGSGCVVLIKRERGAFWLMMSLVLTAGAGGLAYLTVSFPVFAAMFLINSFFLFVFFPLYVSDDASSQKSSNPPARVGLYLFGFAIGGAMAGVVIAQLGYSAFAALIVLSAVPPAAGAWLRARPG